MIKIRGNRGMKREPSVTISETKPRESSLLLKQSLLSVFLNSGYSCRKFVIVLEPYVTKEETFVLDFLTKP